MRKIIVLVAIAFALFLRAGFASAETTNEKLENLQERIAEYTQRIGELQSQALTLNNQIAQFDANIARTELEIEETQERITLLGGRIGQLSDSLSALSQAFESRVAETYKLARFSENPVTFLATNEIAKAVSRFHYLQKIQQEDQELLSRLERAQTTYVAQRDELEILEAELGDKRQVLSAQKSAKAELLSVTRNDERRFQELLAKARAELEAIQAIIAGKGEETEVGGVSEGERIASVIPGLSTCSSGGHLHFEVVHDSKHENPANYLIPKAIEWDNQPDSHFGFSGSWQWPINDPVRITQGFGMTYYAATLNYYGGAPHTGIDMVNRDDFTVKAVRSGTLYRGAIACGGGTLRYVRVQQDGGFDTYYLHVSF